MNKSSIIGEGRFGSSENSGTSVFDLVPVGDPAAIAGILAQGFDSRSTGDESLDGLPRVKANLEKLHAQEMAVMEAIIAASDDLDPVKAAGGLAIFEWLVGRSAAIRQEIVQEARENSMWEEFEFGHDLIKSGIVKTYSGAA
jgi:hypothetical protein